MAKEKFLCEGFMAKEKFLCEGFMAKEKFLCHKRLNGKNKAFRENVGVKSVR